jgi:uncharacterized protein YutE (UPF0331/DUF86 family)
MLNKALVWYASHIYQSEHAVQVASVVNIMSAIHSDKKDVGQKMDTYIKLMSKVSVPWGEKVFKKDEQEKIKKMLRFNRLVLSDYLKVDMEKAAVIQSNIPESKRRKK